MASDSSGSLVGDDPESHHLRSWPLSTRLRVERPGDGTRLVLTVRGEIDLNTVEQLSDAAWTAFGHRPRALAIDLSGVGFLGVVGLRELVALLEPAAIFGCALSVRDPSPAVRRVFELLPPPPQLRIETRSGWSRRPEE
ncbi:MAG TPA: STAS domain-containing protein [Actinospica sp.]|nr:STAS domain-containing protein [Actinospica sp.]